MTAQVMRTVETFSTSRLIAERLRLSDLDELRRMNQDPDVMSMLGGVQTEEDTRRALSKNLEHWDRLGYGLWVFREKSTNNFVGRAGLRNIEIGGNLEVELLYALRSEYWGIGLATEMSKEIISVGKWLLDLDQIIAFTLPYNMASRRVIEKSGFDFEGMIEHAGMPHVLYRLNSN